MRTCDECGKQLVTQRKGARFCDKDCSNAWHNKERRGSTATDKDLTPARSSENGRRRPSRDGHGTRIYLTSEEAVFLARGEVLDTVADKASFAADRIERKEST